MSSSAKPPGSDLEEKYDAYGSMLYRLCLVLLCSRADAEDAVQTTFLRYLSKRPAFNGAEHEKAWFIRVASNVCRDAQRARQRQSRLRADASELPEIDPGHADILRLTLALPPKYRAVLCLHYVEGYKVEEIARMLRLTRPAVKMRLLRGRERLKLGKGGRDMKPQEFTDAVRGIQADPALKEKVLALRAPAHKHKKVPRRILWPVAAALTLLLLTAGLLVLTTGPDASEGLVITAYAAGGKAVGLAPRVKTPLGRYSPLISSVPGFPFEIGFLRRSGSDFTAEIRVDAGALLTREARDGSVTDHGRTLTLRGGSTVYWSPLGENGGTAEVCRMTVCAQTPGGASAEAAIDIRRTAENEYTAEVVSMTSCPVPGTAEVKAGQQAPFHARVLRPGIGG